MGKRIFTMLIFVLNSAMVTIAGAEVITIPKTALTPSNLYYTDIIGGGIGSPVQWTGGAPRSSDPIRNDDAFRGPIPLGFTLSFFGQNYTSFFVNNNGNISFNNGITAFTPNGPQGAPQPIISPFFADVDTRNLTSGVLHLRTDIPNQIIVTWDNVGYFSDHADKLNSFQLVLRGPEFKIPSGEGRIGFFYKTMQWETGDASGGSAGFGGTPAGVGFGDGQSNGVILQGSTQDGISEVTSNTRIWFDLSLNPVPPPPLYTTSYYIQSKLCSELVDLGKRQALQTINLIAPQDGIVILLFGTMPGFVNNEYGTWRAGVFTPVTVPDPSKRVSIENLAKCYLDGYYNNLISSANSHLRVVIGTGNYKLPWNCGSSAELTYNHGYKWGQMINNLASYIVAKGYSSRVDVAGGSDMELAWATPNDTIAWVDGYADASNYYLYNFGDAQGCPNCAHGWTEEDVWQISWKSPPAWPLPQIYNTNGVMARNWQKLVLYSLSQSYGKMIIAGSLTQYGACETRNCHPTTKNTPEDGFVQLQDALNSDSRTTQDLRWSTDIRWQYK